MPVLPFQGSLPVAPRDREWDASAAVRRLQAWARDGDEIDFPRFSRAFMWVDPGERDNVTGYKLPFADVVGGRLTIVPRGVFATAGGRGIPRVDVPRADKDRLERLACRYYDRLASALEDDSIVCPFQESIREAVARIVERRMRPR